VRPCAGGYIAQLHGFECNGDVTPIEMMPTLVAGEGRVLVGDSVHVAACMYSFARFIGAQIDR
jgi:hypothetical protein